MRHSKLASGVEKAADKLGAILAAWLSPVNTIFAVRSVVEQAG